jgi:hypothetical protein
MTRRKPKREAAATTFFAACTGEQSNNSTTCTSHHRGRKASFNKVRIRTIAPPSTHALRRRHKNKVVLSCKCACTSACASFDSVRSFVTRICGNSTWAAASSDNMATRLM